MKRSACIKGILGAFAAAILTLGAPGAPSAQPTTMAEDAIAAARAYADDKVRETVKEQSRAAIVTLYKKLYRSGADKRLVRTLGTVALSAEEINTLAENAADALVSGNPESVKAASEQVAVALGQALTKGLSDPQLRQQMGALLGGVDKAKEIADVLGQAAGGDPRAAYEYAGRALIALTPAAAAFTAAETAVGAMRYLEGKFVDGTLEELYRKYADGDAQTRADVRQQLETAGLYSYIVRQRRIELEQERIDGISRATAEPGEKLRERLTAAHESEVIDDILRTFATRAKQERSAAEAERARQQAQAEAAAMIDALDVEARAKYGRDWWRERPFNLERFTQLVKERIRNDGVLDPSDPQHIRAMSQLLATGLVHGRDSDEYRKQLAGFEEFRRVLMGDPKPGSQPKSPVGEAEAGESCQPGSARREEADRLWAQALRAEKSRDDAALKQAIDALRRSVALCPDPARAAKERPLREAWVRAAVSAAARRVEQSMPNIKKQVDQYRDVRQDRRK
jgi:hypothetical protein